VLKGKGLAAGGLWSYIRRKRWPWGEQQIPFGNDRKKSKRKGKKPAGLSAPHHRNKSVMLRSK